MNKIPNCNQISWVKDGEILEILEYCVSNVSIKVDSSLTVMSKVFEGGDGWIRGGRAERSIDIGLLVPLDLGLDCIDAGGEVLSAMMDDVDSVLNVQRINDIGFVGFGDASKVAQSGETVVPIVA